MPLSGPGSFGDVSAIAAGVVTAVSTSTGYWRSRHSAGQEWRLTLAPWKFGVNAVSVVLVHTILAILATIAGYFVLGQGFIGLTMVPFWAAVLLAINLGLAAHFSYLSASRMTTQRMSSLLMAFMLIGALTATVTTPDPEWWKLHFSHLGTFEDSISSWIFNGTLIAGGLLVTTFGVYVAHDMHALVDRGILKRANAPRIVSVVFVVMGIMLAGVGLVPVDVNLAHPQSVGHRHGDRLPRTARLGSARAQGDAAHVLPRHVGLLRRPDPFDRAVHHAVLRAHGIRDHRVRARVRLDRRVHPVPGPGGAAAREGLSDSAILGSCTRAELPTA